MALKLLKNIKPEYAAVLAAAIILIRILMIRPITGVADNGDFPRIMGSTGLGYYIEMSMDQSPSDPGLQNPARLHAGDLYFGYVNRLYRVVPAIPFGGGYFSTEIPILLSLVFVSQLVHNNWLFDIRYLSAFYSAIFLVSIFFIVRFGFGIDKRTFAARNRLGRWDGAFGWLAAALPVLVFTDTGYVSYFNSLYGEPVTLVFLLLAAGVFLALVLAGRPKIWLLALFFCGAFLFAGAKVQNAPAGILLALTSLRFIKLRPDRLWRTVTLCSAAAVVFISLFTYFSESSDIKVCNKYQTVFFGILKDSADPAGDLEELGLERSWAALAGTNYFMDKYPMDIRSPGFKKELYSKVDYTKIAGFYLKHPGRLLKKLEISAQNAFKLKQGFGNYERYTGIAYKQSSNLFGLWSDFKLKVLPHTLLFICIFYFLFCLVCGIEYFRAVNRKNSSGRLVIEFLAVSGLMGLAGFILPVIGDGEADLSKHLFLFNVCFDMMFIAGIAYALYRLAEAAGILAGRLFHRHHGSIGTGLGRQD